MSGFERAPAIECKSRIDGKLVRVRHASEGDAVFLKKLMESYGLDASGLDYTKYVVADQDRNLLGFGTAAEAGAGGRGFSVYVDEKHGYLAELIVKHLVEHPRP
jgi:hypothetical protein